MDQNNTPHMQLAMFNQQRILLPELQNLITQYLSSILVEQATVRAVMLLVQQFDPIKIKYLLTEVKYL